ncbi:DUF488 domain-containing protein [Parafrigoribacterium soli]|uniref:DUF488 domain-containing protein n=1 Tax=Parafrigoribacterium soli TaxID=3144663 RepID=UPI0032EFCCA9
MAVKIKRVYEKSAAKDGYRVLVDRVWPRGIAKAAAAVDEWLKEVGPSTELRTWFGHEPSRFEGFAEKYRAELDANPAADQLRAIVSEHPTVTLVYSAKDEEHNQAVVLAEYLS